MGKARAQVDELVSRGADEISTSRLGRAARLGKVALGTGRRWAGREAMRALGRGEDGGHFGLGADLYQGLSEMRGLAMKAGQMLSYLDGLLPPEAQQVLTLLQRDAPPMPLAKLEPVLVEDLGAPIQQLFADFDERPLAAASIGQVHRATLPDGTQVAVKIQYPGIEEAMAVDLSNARLMGLLKGALFFRTNTRAILDELETRFLEECDYRREAEHQRRFAARFAGHPTIVIPEVHASHSGRRVLTTTFHRGLGFYEWLDRSPPAAERRRVAAALYRFYLGSFYLDGVFNCDPHPGNYIFQEDGRVVFLDHGAVRTFEPERRRAWVEMCRAVCADDEARIDRAARTVGFIPAGVDYDRAALRDLLRYLYQAHLEDHEFDFSRMRPAETFRQMFSENPNLFRMDMPADAVFLNRITFGLVSILGALDVTLNCHRIVRSYFEGQDPDWPGPDAGSAEPWSTVEGAPEG